jgi:MscS family membrane protein
MTRRRAPLRTLPVALALGLMLAAAAHAQGDAGDAPGPRGSARATMTTFLRAMNDAAAGQDHRLDDAVLCLDLGTEDPDVRRTVGRRRAADLKEILDRTRLIDPQEIPATPDGPPWVFLREAAGEVAIAPADGGEWLFTRRTVESIPDLLVSALRRERVEGVPEAPQVRTPGDWMRSLMPADLRGTVFLLENWQWLGLLLLILAGVIVDRIVAAVTAATARRIFVRLIPGANTSGVAGAVRPAGVLAMGVLWWFGVLWLALPADVLTVLLIAVKFLVASAAVWTAYRLTDIFADYFTEKAKGTDTKYDDLLVPLLRKTVKVFVVAFGLVFIAENLNVDISSLLTGLGLGGLAFALAAQDMVKNLFGSLTVLLDKPFHVGDWVKIGDLEGTVEEVGFRSTRIRTFYNSLITMPNANLISTAVDNLGARTYRRWSTMLSLTYDTPPEKLEEFCEGIRELVRRHPHTRKDYFHVYASEFGAASLNVLLYVFFRTPGWPEELAARHALFLDILRLAREVGVEFAFPTQTLHVHRSEWNPAPWSEDDDAAAKALEEGRAKAAAIAARSRTKD